MTAPRYGLQRRPHQWLLPPAMPSGRPNRIAQPGTTDDPSLAWMTFSIDAAIERQQLLRHAWGITTTIRRIP